LLKSRESFSLRLWHAFVKYFYKSLHLSGMPDWEYNKTMNKKTVIVIPARYASTRLAGKMLLKVQGKPIIQWVWEKAAASKSADAVIIATESEIIMDAAKSFGAYAEMTSSEHQSGSDRIWEVAKRHPEYEYILNLQGDEPMLTADAIDLTIKTVQAGNCDIATLIREATCEEQIQNPNCVKCVFDNDFNALYFSRSPIPYERNAGVSKIYSHMGIYAYTRKALERLTSLPQADLELAESLEQLRALKDGMKIKVALTQLNPIGIDTQEDLEKFENAVRA
jgi:3-deoxy-manno-octulosonate cytidylyltransferase (CMP-KDO synthetase)